MDKYSKTALRGLGRERQERIRVFLECEKAPRDEAPYDFSKGSVRFEYKYSGMHKRNQNLKKKPLSAPIKTWVFQDLMGDGKKKSFDYLILEGNDGDEDLSCYFLIGFAEVSERGKTTYYVTMPASGGGRKRGFRGLSKRGVSKFVWDHNLDIDSLKSEVMLASLRSQGLSWNQIVKQTGIPKGTALRAFASRSTNAIRLSGVNPAKSVGALAV
jgi:hypothetical protein